MGTTTTVPADATIADSVRAMYTGVAEQPPPDLHFPVGYQAARAVGYPEAELDALPADAVSRFAGVGYPFQADVIRPDHVVLDVGSGAGTDLLIAARRVGSRGRAFGLDFTPAMLRLAQDNIAGTGAHHVTMLKGDISQGIPLPDASLDVVTSNGVINLVPDKAHAFSEIHRVLKPGGHMQLADIVVNQEIPDTAREDATLWAACIAGARHTDEYSEMIQNAGFREVNVLQRLDYFANAPREDARETAARFEAETIVLHGRKST